MNECQEKFRSSFTGLPISFLRYRDMMEKESAHPYTVLGELVVQREIPFGIGILFHMYIITLS
jgi:hypothetical protein